MSDQVRKIVEIWCQTVRCENTISDQVFILRILFRKQRDELVYLGDVRPVSNLPADHYIPFSIILQDQSTPLWKKVTPTDLPMQQFSSIWQNSTFRYDLQTFRERRAAGVSQGYFSAMDIQIIFKNIWIRKVLVQQFESKLVQTDQNPSFACFFLSFFSKEKIQKIKMANQIRSTCLELNRHSNGDNACRVGIIIKNQLSCMDLASKYQGIVIKRRETYSCLQRVLCCRCFSCCQEERILTSDIRKETIQRMMETYLVQYDDKSLLDTFKLMILIYICNDDSIPSKHIDRCKINPSTGVINYRTDLEFYLPQICNYLVFHRNLENNYLRQAVEKMCELNFYFAHLYFYYMKSIQRNITGTEIQILKPVVDYNIKLAAQLSQNYSKIKLTCLDLYLDEECSQNKCEDEFVKRVIVDYESSKASYGKFTKVKTTDVELHQYHSIFDQKKGQSLSFESNLNFFNDLFYVSEDLKNHENKKEKVVEYLKLINEKLPAAVYIPFAKNSYRLCNVLKIVTSEVKIFSTKERTPICLCIETYCPAEALSRSQESAFWTNVETPITLKMMTFNNRKNYFARNFEQTASFRFQRQTSALKRSFAPSFASPFIAPAAVNNIMQEQKLFQIEENSYKLKEYLLDKQAFTPSLGTEERKSMNIQVEMKTKASQNNSRTVSFSDNSKIFKEEYQMQQINSPSKDLKELKGYNSNTKKFYDKAFEKMYGQPLFQSKKRIAKNSVFGNFASWDILYLIVKTNDDLKQEQFAMQLIHQFDYIFKLEKLPLLLTTYEVLSMGPDRGIIEMVRDSVTFDSLKKTLKRDFPSALVLRDFFEIYFSEDLMGAKQNFMKSLAAYCVVMYILQAKDRHNGNILLHRNGKIFHIDFGFFLSNSPGKGIEIERDCPFKLLTEYIEVLDGVDSYYFKKFREYFFLGFKAIRKHQDKILMIVKMMYSTSGMSMPCFAKGEAAITALQERINPPGVDNDLLLNEHCQLLINRSLDNWASKWYDRFQYWAQGIFY